MVVSRNSVKGGVRLVFDAVEGVSNRVEKMHETIASRPSPIDADYQDTGSHGPVAARVYSTIRGVNHLLREGVDRLPLQSEHRGASGQMNDAAEVKWVAAVNGVCGDHLEATNNALSIPMQFRVLGHESSSPLGLTSRELAEQVQAPSPHLVIMVHGLGMSEFGWRRKGLQGLGDCLEQQAGFTPLYLRYNTGRHISTNGRQLSAMLEGLCQNWPVAVESVSLVGHSMGGLIVRSACWYASEQNQGTGAGWLAKLQRVLCLGSPHQGAPLEKFGHMLDSGARNIPYLMPLMFASGRSAGIKDLRRGDLLDEDWQVLADADERQAVPLLDGVDYYFVAASIGRHQNDSIGVLLGDLLVRVDSAVGYHKQQGQCLPVNEENCRIYFEKNHFDLLSDTQVADQVVDWFGG